MGSEIEGAIAKLEFLSAAVEHRFEGEPRPHHEHADPGGRAELGNGAILRPFMYAGVSFLSQDDWKASARLRATREAPAAEESVEYTPLELAERTRIVHAMNAAKWRPLQAAAMLGISRATLYRRLKQLHIVAPHRQ